MRVTVAACVGLAAAVSLGAGVYAASKVLDLRDRYGDDDRIMIHEVHAVAWTVLGVVVAAWAVHLLRGGQPPTEDFWRLRPADWSGWMLGVGFAFLAAFGTAGGYDVGRSTADAYRADVHGTLTVERCVPLEHGYECEGAFRSDDGSVRVAHLSGHTETEQPTLQGWVSGPRPLALHQSQDAGLAAVVMLAIFCSALAGALLVVAARKAHATLPR